jgi:hypothetical protein
MKKTNRRLTAALFRELRNDNNKQQQKQRVDNTHAYLQYVPNSIAVMPVQSNITHHLYTLIFVSVAACSCDDGREFKGVCNPAFSRNTQNVRQLNSAMKRSLHSILPFSLQDSEFFSCLLGNRTVQKLPVLRQTRMNKKLQKPLTVQLSNSY